MRAVMWLVAAAGAFVIFFIIKAATMSPAESARLSRQAEAERMCDQAMQDSALGSERRTTREICDQLKAKLKSE